MSAYKHAYFHPDRLVELIDRVSRERGEDVSIGSFFNDRTTHRPAPDDPLPAAQDLHALREKTSFAWTAKEDNQTERFFVHVDDASDGLRLEIRIDTHHISPAAAEAFARGMEEAAIAAALAPGGAGDARDRAPHAPAGPAGGHGGTAGAAEVGGRRAGR